MRLFCHKNLLGLMLITLPLIAEAVVPAWQINPKDSSLSFTATQNDAPVSGQFKTFSGDILFDPDQLGASSVKIVVDMASISDPYNQLSDTLKSTDWFNAKIFPTAVFQSNRISKTGDKTYEAQGTLTLRDKTVPVTLKFTQEEYTQTKARMKGGTVLKRTAFGVGQGEWADTKSVKDDVQVNFTIVAEKK